MKHRKCNPDEQERVSPHPESIVKRRHILKSGLATAFAVAGGTVVSVISCISEIFSLSDDGTESS